ncbi:unnamed protein product [Dibothriocephalus latus]|uniref:Uncharacterized protein n=1 Tax=Dibothriocephalus latus TaxID=60516 RepID=A0A3P7LNB4_DIBLA|nr:unnamed protein product [Dibothriocephalus latus]
MQSYGGYSVHCDAPDLNEPVLTESGYCGVAISTSDSYVPQNSALFKVPVVGRTSTVLPSEEKPLLELEHRFGVCVPALHNMEQINPRRLDEWIEIHMRLGRSYCTPFLEGLAIDIELIPLIWSDDPDIISRSSWYYFQIITINDCLYRTADRGTLTNYFWGTALHYLTRPGYGFNSALFPTNETEDFERPFHRDYTRRVETEDSMRRKCLVRPLWIFEMGIHHVSKPYEESTGPALNPGSEHSEMAVVHHYRKGDIAIDGRTIEDKSLERFLP